MRGLAVLAALAVGSIAPTALAQQSPDDFAFDLFKGVVAAHPGKNVFLSPASARWALGMAYAGSAGDTRKAMARALGALPPAENLKFEGGRIASLLSADQKVTLRVANSLWLKRGFPFKKDFVSAVAAAYRAEVFDRDFVPADVVEANDWVKGKTEGKIPSILEKFEPRDRVVLINAVYFKGRWTDQFNKETTTPEDFHLEGAEAVKHPLMERRGDYPYFEGAGFQALRLPYGSGRLGMLVLLPARGRTLESLVAATADAAGWRAVRAGLRLTPGRARLPRFKVEFSAELASALSGLGLGVAFDSRRADFSGMADAPSPADRLSISKVLQKTFVEVNEEGAEAAAATAVMMPTAQAVRRPISPFEFRADRPFLYAIDDRATGEILFLGALYDPR